MAPEDILAEVRERSETEYQRLIQDGPDDDYSLSMEMDMAMANAGHQCVLNGASMLEVADRLRHRSRAAYEMFVEMLEADLQDSGVVCC